MPTDERLLTLVTYVRVVEVPGDLFDVHLVVEVNQGQAVDPRWRAPVTICGLVGYRATQRATNACDECRRGFPDAARAGLDACRAEMRGA